MTLVSRVFRWTLITVVLLSAGCSRPQRYQIVLEQQESIAVDAPVFVDSIRAGRVTDVGTEADDRVADIEITNTAVRDRLRVGALRIVQSDRIQIRTDAVREGARTLPNGARIPTSSMIGYLVTKYSQKSTLAILAGTLLGLIVICLVFRSLVGTIGLVLCVTLAGIATQVVHPYCVPYVERIMSRIAPSAPVATRAANEAVNSDTARVLTPSPVAKAYKNAESTIIEVINTRPSPVVLTWCAVFVVLFVGFNIVLGRASRVWRK